MYKDKNSRKAIGWANSFNFSVHYYILVIFLCNCAPKMQKVVYFREPKYKGYETSRSHKHIKTHKPNFIPIRDNIMSHEIVEKYNSMYKKKHDINEKNTLSQWTLILLITIGAILGVSLLI